MKRVNTRAMMTLGLLAVASLSLATGVITGVETRKSGDGIEVLVKGTDLSTPKEERAWKGQTYILSFDAKMQVKGERVNLNHGGVTYAQWTQFTTRPLVARIVLRLRPEDKPNVTLTDDGWLISVNANGKKETTAAESNTIDEGNSTRSKIITFGDAPKPTPEQVKPNTLPNVNPPKVVASGVAETPKIAGVIPVQPTQKLVSLNFESTETVLILKALAAQAGINIVTSPDVKGAISVQFDNVTVEHALQIITAISGLRYQKVNNTIIVAPADKIAGIVANASSGEMGGARLETRIVPVFSHQAKQIRSAVYRVLPQDAKGGRYDLVLPSEQMMPGAEKPVEADPSKPPTTAANANNEPDDYVMIIGSPGRLEDVIAAVKALDNQICDAVGIDVPRTSAPVQETYYVKGANAMLLLGVAGVKDGKLGNVSVVATPPSSSARQAIVLTGRENDVRRIVEMFNELDAPPSEDEQLIVYEVMHVDPRGLRDALMSHIPGVRAQVPPAGAGGTRLYKPVTFDTGDGKTGGESSKGSEDTGKTDSGKVGASEGLKSGLGQPFSELEPVAVPMKLILRGDSAGIRRAMDLLHQLDTPPAQVALELRVMELTKEDAIQAGIDWNLFTGGAVKFLRLNNSQASGTPANNSVGLNINDRNIKGDVVATLDQIANGTNLIARPNLVAYDGRETEIFIGDVIRYVESITSSQNGPSVQIGEIRVGVNLAVLARISSDGTATLDVRPTVSSLKGFNRISVSGFAADLPQTTETVSQNTVEVKDGETIAIGGLITDQIVKQSKGIPILMDLPILGNLFKSSTTTKNRRELVLFLTTKKITGPLGSGPNLPFEDTLTKPEDRKPK